MNICKLIEMKRKEKGYKTEQMADFVGYSKSAYEHWEKGRRQWTIDTIVQICEILDLELILNKEGVFIMENNKMCKLELDVSQKYIDVVADYQDYKIVKLYAKNEILGIKNEECFNPIVENRENIVETLKDAIIKFGDDYSEAYAIVNKINNKIMDDYIVRQFHLAESLYYKYYAPAIETFEVNILGDAVLKEVVYIGDNFKIARNHHSAVYDIPDAIPKLPSTDIKTWKVMLKLLEKSFYLYNNDNKHYNMACVNYRNFDEAINDVKALKIYELFRKDENLLNMVSETEDFSIPEFLKEFEDDEERLSTDDVELMHNEEF